MVEGEANCTAKEARMVEVKLLFEKKERSMTDRSGWCEAAF